MRRKDLILAAHFVLAVAPRKFDRRFVGFGAAVAEKRAVGERVAAQLAGQLGLRLHVIEIGNVEQLLRLLLDRLDDRGMAVAETVDGNAAKKIEIFFAVGVPNLAASTFDEGDRRASVSFGDELIGERGDIPVLHHFLTTSVPTPSLVKISKSTACFTRPSMMWVFSTPPLSALMQHSTLGIIPEPTTPS